MSGSVDNRVVSMKFDNASFENNMKTTMSSLEKLKASLNFKGAAKSMSEVSEASGKFNLNPMGVAVEGISTKFLALSTVAVTALSNITNKAINAGTQLVKSLSVDQISSGFQEYETNMNSIQTVLANTKSKGSNLEDVNKALDQLNHYSDQTIYNFSEMAKNIGTFTAAGVDLDTSVSSIKGIANLAAISGSNSEQASTAMYQLSQAIASGSVKLMDWNSVVNAGMGGEVFQKALFESGKAMKTLTDVDAGTSFEEWTKAGNTFRGSLEKGWLTSEVLTNTLQGFTGDMTEAQIVAIGYTKEQAKAMMDMGKTGQEAATKVKTFTQLMGTLKESVGSGWSESFRTVIGDFEQARNLFSGLAGLFGGVLKKSADSRNDLLKGWAAFGGRENLMQGILIGLDAMAKAIKPIKDAFRNIFPPATAKDLIELTVKFRDFMAKLVLGKTKIDQLTRIFSGLFAAVKIGWTAFKELAKVVLNLFSSFSGAGGGALDYLVRLGDSLTNLNKKLVEGGGITKFFKDMTDKVTTFVGKLGFSDKIDKVRDALNKFKNSIQNLFNKKDAKKGEDVASTFDSMKKKMAPLVAISDSLRKAWDKLTEIFSKIRLGIKMLSGAISDELSGVWSNISDQLKGGSEFSGILKIVNVGLIGGLLGVFRKFVNDGIKLDFGGGFLEGIRDSIDGLTSHLKVMQGEIKARTLLKIAQAIALLTVSVVVLSLIDAEALTKALTAMAVGFGQLIGTMALLSKLNTGVKLPLLTASLIALSAGILVLALAIKVFSSMESGELAQGLLGIAAVMAILVIAVKNFSAEGGGMVKAGLAMLILAVGVNILAIAIGKFGEMDLASLVQGVVALGAVLFMLVVAVKKLDKVSGQLVRAGIAMYIMGKSVGVMALAIESFGKMNFLVMMQGLLGVAVALAILTIAVNKMPKDLTKVSIGMTLVSVALGIMLQVIEGLGKMSWESLAKGIGGMAVILLVMSLAANSMVEALPGAIAIVVMAGALFVLGEVLKTLGKLSWEEIGKGLAAIAGVLLVFGLAGYLLTPVVPVLFALGIALLTVAAAFLVFGLAAVLFATAFKTFAEFGKAGIDLFISGLDALITRIPEIIEALATGLIDAAAAIFDRTPELIEGIVNMIGALITELGTLIPKIGTFVTDLIEELLKLLVDKGPDIIEGGYTLLIAFLKGIRDNIAEIVTLVSDIVLEFTKALTAKVEDLAKAGADLLVAIIKGVTDNMQKVIDATAIMMLTFIYGITLWVDDIIDAGVELVKELIRGIGDGATDIADEGVRVFRKFLKGLNKNIKDLTDAAGDFIVEFIEGLTAAVERDGERIRKAGKDLAWALINGFTGGLAEKARGLAEKVLEPFKGAWEGVKNFFDVNSPSKLTMKLGGAVVEGFTIGIDKNAVSATNSATTFGSSVVKSLNKSFSNISTSLDGMGEFKPVIAPVLDLTAVKKEAGTISDILTAQDLAATMSYNQAAALSVSSTATDVATPSQATPSVTEFKFEQNNYSPEALSVNDIYRDTENLINRVKRELGVA